MKDEIEEDDFELPAGVVRAAPKKGNPEKEPLAVPLPPGPRSPVPGPASSPRISALEPQKQQKNRVNVYVDGKFVLGVFAEVAAALGLKVGQAMSPERLEELNAAETKRKAKEDAYQLLSFRARSQKEVTDRLQQKGYTEEVITETVDSLKEYGFVDDERFASAWVESRGKTRGKQALAFELRQKGVDRETVRETLSERSGSAEITAARVIAVKRVGERPTDTSREAKAKLAAYLGRRGFNWETIRPVLAELYGRTDDADDFLDSGEE